MAILKPVPDDPAPLPGKGGGSSSSPGGGSAGANGANTDNVANLATDQATLLPTCYGRVKLVPSLIEKLPTSLTLVPAWAATSYQVGQIVNSNGNAYRALTDGTAVNAPSGSGVTTAASPAQFVTGQAVGRGYIRENSGNAYIALVGGVCGLTGPFGTASSILDSGGVIVWAYLGAEPLAGIVVDAHVSGSTLVVDMIWQYLQAMPYNTYSQSFVLGLCEGEISKAISIWVDKQQYAVTDAAGLLLPTGLKLFVGPDALGQTLLVGYDVNGYQHTAVITPITGAGIFTGPQVELSDYAVELDTVTFGSSTPDVNFALMVNDWLTHPRRGFGWASSLIDVSVTGSGAASLMTWCDAKGVRGSVVIDSATAGTDFLADLSSATNTVLFMGQGKLKAVPLDDTPTTSPVYGSVNYVPNNVARYNIAPSDIRSGQPVSYTRRGSADRNNIIPVEYTDRGGNPADNNGVGYVGVRVQNVVLSDVRKRGPLYGSPLSLPFIFADDTWPVALSRIAANQSIYNCNTYSVVVGDRFIALEPGDIVTIPVGDSILNYRQVPVIIQQIDEDSSFDFTLTCVDYPAGIAAPARFSGQRGDGLRGNSFNTTGSLPQAYQSAAQTNPAPDNLFPNGTSEASPPSYINVLNDGSLPEWDYRKNAGAGAFSGNWVRELTTPTLGSKSLNAKIACSPGDQFSFSVQTQITLGGAAATSLLNIQFFDVSNTFLSGGASTIGSFLSWTQLSVQTGLAPAGAVYALLSIGVATTGLVAPVTAQFDAIIAKRIPAPGKVNQGLTTDATGATVWAGDTGWTAVAFAGTFANLGGAFATAAYRKDPNGYVHVKGIITGGTSGGNIFTLPAGYRPLETHQFAQKQTAGGVDGYAEISVQASGVVTASAYAATGNMTIDAVFLGEQ